MLKFVICSQNCFSIQKEKEINEKIVFCYTILKPRLIYQIRHWTALNWNDRPQNILLSQTNFSMKQNHGNKSFVSHLFDKTLYLFVILLNMACVGWWIFQLFASHSQPQEIKFKRKNNFEMELVSKIIIQWIQCLLWSINFWDNIAI